MLCLSCAKQFYYHWLVKKQAVLYVRMRNPKINYKTTTNAIYKKMQQVFFKYINVIVYFLNLYIEKKIWLEFCYGTFEEKKSHTFDDPLILFRPDGFIFIIELVIDYYNKYKLFSVTD